MYTCIEKIRDKHSKITHYKLKEINTGEIIIKSTEVVRKALLRNSNQVDNLKITSDNRIIDKRVSNIIILYHGSPNQVINVEFGKGEDKHDHGRGFYLTPYIELAKEWSVANNNKIGYVHEYKIDITNLKIFDFDKVSELNWIAELMSHRDAADSTRYKKLAPIFIKMYKLNLSGYDIIKGWRADSSFFSIGKKFVRDEIDITLLKTALHLGDLNTQFCLKSRKAMNSIISSKVICNVDGNEYYKKYEYRDRQARTELDKLIKSDKNTCLNTFSDLIKEKLNNEK